MQKLNPVDLSEHMVKFVTDMEKERNLQPCMLKTTPKM
jgi:hypothetical protein